jgi:phage-related protein
LPPRQGAAPATGRTGSSIAEAIGVSQADVLVLVCSYNILYGGSVTRCKAIEFMGSALDDLRAFPVSARREAGHQLDRLQHGEAPDDWKPMSSLGTGVQEIRIHDPAGAFRVIYVATFPEAIYVLHCFQKKFQKTAKLDRDLAAQRYRTLLKEPSP